MHPRRPLALALFTLTISLPIAAAAPPAPSQPAEIHVGIDSGDVRGADNRALQAAIEQVARLGGGTVHIGPGRYLMRNALTLRDNVRLIGTPGKTVLVVADAVRTRLASDGDCNERQVTLEDPTGFQVGDGIAIADERFRSGFTVTTATLTARIDAKTFRISTPLYLDYMMAQKATVRRAFPVIGGWHVKNAAVEGLTIEGNRAKAEPLDGCRGGGIYLFECANVALRQCVVRGYNGDGISFQVSAQVTVEDCLCEDNAGLGLHPGSGSQQPVLRRNRSLNNGGDGLFVCWRVKHGVFEDNEVRGNRGVGISIGHKDTDNLFRGNTIVGNGGAGVLFRDETEPMGAHRNRFEKNRILDNGTAGEAAIVIRGHHHDLVFEQNIIGREKTATSTGPAIRLSKHARGLKATDNQFLNVTMPIEAEK